MKQTIRCLINAEKRVLNVYPMKRLLDVLREEAGFTGTKEGCGEGECGACSVFLNGKLVNSCLVPALQADQSEIVTIEGIASEAKLHPFQEAFVACNGAQCGICTPGMILAAIALLKKYPRPDEEQIRKGLAGNLCRCTGYTKIFESIYRGSRRPLQRQSRWSLPLNAASRLVKPSRASK